MYKSSSSLLGRDQKKAYLTSRHTDHDKKANRQKEETKTRRKRKGEEEENQNETVIRLQSILLCDLFRILNRESRSTKTKDETIIR